MGEPTLIVSLKLPTVSNKDFNESIEELKRLAYTASAEIIGEVVQKKDSIDPGYFIGKGKAEEIGKICKEKKINTILFDDDFSPAQQKNLEGICHTKIIDRTRLILDIFAKRAHSREGILQVELAQLSYLLPRITERFGRFEQQVGGIGTRGPGEKKLEYEQRTIRDRISLLKKNIEKIKKQRNLRREKRENIPIPVVSIVGYTNSGKSTLLNTLTEKKVAYADDKLFATLDPLSRKVKFANGQTVIFTDTVGFIRKLPHQLVASFHATLEEIKESDILLHIIDISNPNHRKEEEIVCSVLKELGVNKDIPVIMVYNKIDKLKNFKPKNYDGNIYISALNEAGISELLNRISELLEKNLEPCDIFIPYKKIGLISKIYETGTILKKRFNEDGLNISLKIDRKNLGRINKALA